MMNGLLAREWFGLQTAFDNQIPIAVVMGGGYASDIGAIVRGIVWFLRWGSEIFKTTA